MRIQIDHHGFQRTALGAVAACGTAACGAVLAGAPPDWVRAVALGAAAAPLALAVQRARGGGRRLAVAVLGAVAGIAGAWAVFGAFALPEAGALTMMSALSVAGAAGAGALSGLVAALGASASWMRLQPSDPLVGALAAARADLDGTQLQLCERAAAALAHVRAAAAGPAVRGAGAGAGGDARRAAAEVEATARRVVLEIVAVARRLRAHAREAERAGAGDLEGRLTDLDARIEAAADEVARDGYRRARAVVEDQRRRLASLHATTDRIEAALHVEVATLEGTALAMAARGGAATAEDAAALAPLADRLRRTSADMDLESEAAGELAAV